MHLGIEKLHIRHMARVPIEVKEYGRSTQYTKPSTQYERTFCKLTCFYKSVFLREKVDSKVSNTSIRHFSAYCYMTIHSNLFLPPLLVWLPFLQGRIGLLESWEEKKVLWWVTASSTESHGSGVVKFIVIRVHLFIIIHREEVCTRGITRGGWGRWGSGRREVGGAWHLKSFISASFVLTQSLHNIGSVASS